MVIQLHSNDEIISIIFQLGKENLRRSIAINHLRGDKSFHNPNLAIKVLLDESEHRVGNTDKFLF